MVVIDMVLTYFARVCRRNRRPMEESLIECMRQLVFTPTSSYLLVVAPLEDSFFGFRPGFGLAGITHSLEAVLPETIN
jgi:hypothetical protein